MRPCLVHVRSRALCAATDVTSRARDEGLEVLQGLAAVVGVERHLVVLGAELLGVVEVAGVPVGSRVFRSSPMWCQK